MNRTIPVIILLGAPGAGKGTQAVYLSRERGIPKVSTGDMLRSAVQENSELGRKVKVIMEEGRLVDDETILRLIQLRIAKPDCQNGFILDGYPRNLRQAEQLEDILLPNMELRVYKIAVPEEEIIKRIAGRRTCSKCQTVYNVYFHPPSVEGRCDLDGALLFRRDDDREEVVRLRLATYQKETYPLIDHYSKKGVLRVVDGTHPAEQIAAEIGESLGVS